MTTTKRRKRGGVSSTPEYLAWKAMLARCEKPHHPSYKYYGGRGITVCERWHEFPAFLADMGYRPDGRSLERIDNEAGYSPENCRWATWPEQLANRRPQVARCSKLTHCKHGHPFSPENTWVSKHGRRVCKTCKNRYFRGWYARRQAERAA